MDNHFSGKMILFPYLPAEGLYCYIDLAALAVTKIDATKVPVFEAKDFDGIIE